MEGGRKQRAWNLRAKHACEQKMWREVMWSVKCNRKTEKGRKQAAVAWVDATVKFLIFSGMCS